MRVKLSRVPAAPKARRSTAQGFISVVPTLGFGRCAASALVLAVPRFQRPRIYGLA